MLPLMMTSMTISFMFPFTNHPLSMGLVLILQTLTTALLMGMTINSFLISYMLTMMMISGALILFIYMASVASNEKFKSSISMLLIPMTTSILLIIMSILEDQLEYKKNWSSKIDTLSLSDNIISMAKLFNPSNMFITILMVGYLFLTMIVVSHIVSTNEGPLRTKN